MDDPTQLTSDEPIQVTPGAEAPNMGETNLAAPEISVTPEKPEFIQGATSLESPKPIQQTISGLPHEVLFDPDKAEPMSEDDYLKHLDDQKIPAWSLQDKDPDLAYKLWQKQNPDQTVGGVLEGATRLGLKTAGNVLGGLYKFEAGAYTHPIDTASSLWDGTKSLWHAVVAQPANFIYQNLVAQGANAKPEDYITLGYSVEDATRMARDAQDAAKTAVPQAAAGQVALANFARDQVDAATRLSSHLAGALGYRMVRGMEHDISPEDAVAYMKHQRESDEMKQALDKGDINAAMKVFAPAWLHAEGEQVQQVKDAIDQHRTEYPGTDDLKQLGLTSGDIKEAAESGPSTLSLLEFSAVPGGVGRAVGEAAAGAIPLAGKVAAGGLRTGATVSDFAQQKMLWAARHGYWTLGYGLINPHVILPALGTILGAEGVGRYVLPRVSQGLRAVARGAEALPATEAGKLGAKVSAYAASGATQFAPFAVTSNNLDEASQHLAMGAAFGIGHMAGSAALGTRYALMRSLVNIGGERPFPWSDQHFDYGSDPARDAMHAEEVGTWSNANQKMLNMQRHALQNGARSYALSPTNFDNMFRNPGTPYVDGLYLEPGESVTLNDGTVHTPDSPEIYYRGENGFKNAKVHEPGHVIWDTLEDADKARFFKSVSKNNDPSAWATSYMSRLTGKHTPIDYDKLPDKGPGVTKALIQEEMFADTIKNFTIDQVTSDPGLTRKLQFGIAKFMESMGVPMTPPEIRGSLGLQPTAHAMFVAENAMRQYASRSSGPVKYGTPRAEGAAPAAPEPIVSETVRVAPKDSGLPSDIKPGPIKGTPPEKVQKGEFAKEGYTAKDTDIGDPQTHLKPAVDAVRSLGFSANDAKMRVQNAIEEAKNMGLDVNLEDVVKRAINPDHSWPKEVVDRAQEALQPPTVEQEAEAHAKGLAEDSPALTGRTGPHGTFEITGNQIDVNDPFHQKLLKEAGLGPEHVDLINAMGAFKDLPVQFEYRGSGEGKSEGKLKLKKFIPQKIVYNPKAKSFVVRGFSPDKFMQMDQALKQVLADHGVTPDRIDEAMSDPEHPAWDQPGIKNALASLGKGQAMTESIRPERIASPVKAANLENMSPFHREEKPSNARTDSKGQMGFKFMPNEDVIPNRFTPKDWENHKGKDHLFIGSLSEVKEGRDVIHPDHHDPGGFAVTMGELKDNGFSRFTISGTDYFHDYDPRVTFWKEGAEVPRREGQVYNLVDFPNVTIKEMKEAETMWRLRDKEYDADFKAMPSNPDITKVIDDYKKQAKIPFPAHDQAREISESRSKEIADLYQSLPHDPGSPEVAKSYDALRDAVVDQYKTLLKHGYAFEPWEKDGQPYANSKEMLADLADNKHLYYFPTKEGYGSGDLGGNTFHPMLEKPGIKINGEQVPFNDIFRAVHDALGHGEHGWQFGPKGEYNAFLSHASSLPYDALPALAMETLGQNSWVNFGPHMRDAEGNIAKKGEPDYIPPTARPFAEQKANVLPRDLFPVTEGRVGSAGMWDRMTKDPNFLPGQMEDLAAQSGANPDKSFFDQKPDVRQKITDHMMEQGAKFMPRPGPETGASRIQDAGDGPLYHVTFTKAVPSIKKKGLQVFRPSNWGRTVGGAYQTPEVFAFDNLNDAARWAARMDWEFNQNTGSGKISIVKINRGDRPWAPDINDPISQAGAQGNWVKREGGVKADDIVSVTPFTSERVKHLRDRTDQPKFMPSGHPDAITDAAWKDADGKIFTGSWHGEAIDKLLRHHGVPEDVEWDPVLVNTVDGFVDKNGKFYTRKQALKHAEKIGQVTNEDLFAATHPHSDQEPRRINELEKGMFDDARKFMPSSHPDAIVDAAIRRKSDGKIWTGPNHAQAYVRSAGELKGRDIEDGFITKTGRFLDRHQALAWAKEIEQMTQKDYEEGYKKTAGPIQYLWHKEDLRSQLEADAFQVAAKFMPSDHPDAIGDTAVMTPDEKVWTGRWAAKEAGLTDQEMEGSKTGAIHMEIIQALEASGEYTERQLEDAIHGYESNSGEFLTRSQGYFRARQNHQLDMGKYGTLIRKYENQSSLADMDSLNFEDSAKFMPSDHPDAVDRAAIRRKEDGAIFPASPGQPHYTIPANHPEAENYLGPNGHKLYDEIFLDKFGNPLDREQAMTRMKEIGQLSQGYQGEYGTEANVTDLRRSRAFQEEEQRALEEGRAPELLAEDMWPQAGKAMPGGDQEYLRPPPEHIEEHRKIEESVTPTEMSRYLEFMNGRPFSERISARDQREGAILSGLFNRYRDSSMPGDVGKPKAMPQTGQPFEQVLFRGHQAEDPTKTMAMLPTFSDSAYVSGEYARGTPGSRVGFYKVTMKNPIVLPDTNFAGPKGNISYDEIMKTFSGILPEKQLKSWAKDFHAWRGNPKFTDNFYLGDDARFVEMLKRAGYDGIIYRGTHTTDNPSLSPSRITGVNRGVGSYDPYTYSAMEYRPFNPDQVQPSVLPAKYMPSGHPDAITEPAVKTKAGKIFTGFSHGDAALKAEASDPGNYNEWDLTDGWVDKRGKFYDREQARNHAIKIGQLSEYKYNKTSDDVGTEPDQLEIEAFQRAKKFMPQTHDTTFDMSGPKEVRQTLKKGNRWAIFSADTNKFTEAQNQARRSLLKDELDKLGYPYQEAEGNYQGAKEGSVIIGNIDSDAAAKLAKKYGQESLVVPEGLRYTDGKLYPHNGKIEVSKKPFESDYTKVGDSYFQYGVDFDNEISKADYKTIRDLPQDERDLVIKTNNGINRLLDVYHQAKKKMPEAIEGSKLAESQRDWYNDAADIINEIFEPADADRFAAVTAAMSVRTEPIANMDQAIKMWELWEQSGRTHDRGAIDDMVEEAMAYANTKKWMRQGNAARGAGLKAYGNNVYRALTAEDASPMALTISGPKVQSFHPNLTNHVEMLREVTNDRHMAGFWMDDPKYKYGTEVRTKDQIGGVGLKSPEYIALSVATRKLADTLSKLDGKAWTPRQAQAALWSYQKAKSGGTQWGRTRPTIQDVETFTPTLKEWRDKRESRQTPQPTAPEIAEQPF